MALPSVAKLDHEPVDSLYQIYDEKPSGLGEYGKVYDAVPRNPPRVPLVVKELFVRNDECLKLFHTEVRAMRLVTAAMDTPASTGHSVVAPASCRFPRLYHAHHDTATKRMLLVMDRVSGHPLFSSIARSPYSESDVAAVFLHVVEAVAHLHSLGIVHRDLQPDNILLRTVNTTSDVVVRDFGSCRVRGFYDGFKASRVGASPYCAPEACRSDTAPVYSEKSDVWALGVLLYILVHGFSPFSPPRACACVDTRRGSHAHQTGATQSGDVSKVPDDDDDDDDDGGGGSGTTPAADAGGGGGASGAAGAAAPAGVAHQDSDDDSHVTTPSTPFAWQFYPGTAPASEHVRDLLQRCLARRPEDRPTAAAIARHPWFTHAPHRAHPRVCERLRVFNADQRFRRTLHKLHAAAGFREAGARAAVARRKKVATPAGDADAERDLRLPQALVGRLRSAFFAASSCRMQVSMGEFAGMMAMVDTDFGIAEELFQAFDADKDGFVSYPEFLEGISMLMSDTESLFEVFSDRDTNGMTEIGFARFVYALRADSLTGPHTVQAEAPKLVKLFAAGAKDGVLTFPGLVRAVRDHPSWSRGICDPATGSFLSFRPFQVIAEPEDPEGEVCVQNGQVMSTPTSSVEGGDDEVQRHLRRIQSTDSDDAGEAAGGVKTSWLWYGGVVAAGLAALAVVVLARSRRH